MTDTFEISTIIDWLIRIQYFIDQGRGLAKSLRKPN